MIVRLFLIGSVVAVAVWLVRARPGAHRLALSRLGVLVFAACWVLAVLRPDLVSWLANRAGVGRGTDLVLYVLVVAFTFATIGQYQRLRLLEERLADLTRASALLQHELEHLRKPSTGSHG